MEEVENDYDTPEVLLPDTSMLKAAMESQLPLGYLVIMRAKETVVFDNLQCSLIYIGQLCDDDCKILLNKNKLYAFKKKITRQ